MAIKQPIQSLRVNLDSQNSLELIVAESEYHDLLHQREIFWCQSTKLFWFKEGDLNTRTFDSFASARKRYDKITRLKDEFGQWVTEELGFKDLMVSYFENIFRAEANVPISAVDTISSRVSEYQNEELLLPFSADEIRQVMFSLHSDKSPGVDGLNLGFYKLFLPLIREAVTAECLQVLNMGSMPDMLGDTALVLLPKFRKPETVKDLRPISLCKVSYKIVAKTLANRLKNVLPSLISENQCAFVPNHHIRDNYLIAYEMLHYLCRKTKGRVSGAAFKLDISKAYDRVDWLYLQKVIENM